MNSPACQKVIFCSTLTQKGQAIVETTLVLVVFLIILFSIIFTQKISERNSDMLNHGLSLAISSARGATLPGVRHHAMQDRQADSLNNHQMNAMKELGLRTNGWSIAESDDTLIIPKLLQTKDFIQPVSLHAFVMVKGKVSHASDPAETIRTLAQSGRIWGNPAALTRHLTSALTMQAHLTDVAWKRPKPNQDLLTDWKHIAP